MLASAGRQLPAIFETIQKGRTDHTFAIREGVAIVHHLAYARCVISLNNVSSNNRALSDFAAPSRSIISSS
jgi:hypothetical protein